MIDAKVPQRHDSLVPGSENTSVICLQRTIQFHWESDQSEVLTHIYPTLRPLGYALHILLLLVTVDFSFHVSSDI